MLPLSPRVRHSIRAPYPRPASGLRMAAPSLAASRRKLRPFRHGRGRGVVPRWFQDAARKPDETAEVGRARRGGRRFRAGRFGVVAARRKRRPNQDRCPRHRFRTCRPGFAGLVTAPRLCRADAVNRSGPRPDGRTELTKPRNALLAVCAVLGIAAGSFALSSCGGGGGGGGGGGARTSAPHAVITPPGGRTSPVIPLTGVNVVLRSSTSRTTHMIMSTEPEGSEWSGITFDVEPYYAGTPCCTHNINGDLWFRVDCATGYTGEAVAKVDVTDPGGNRAVGSRSFTCR